MTELSSLSADRQNARIRREKTAMHRYGCSRPVALALADGVISKATSVLDYGCGRGADVAYLKSRRVQVVGWDPYHRPKATLAPADVVNLGYVLNVIEDPVERAETLRRAFSFAKTAAVVSVRVDRTLDAANEFSDGLLTGRGTFQKIYTQNEFAGYVDEVLGRKACTVGLGIAYVFRDELAEARFVANRAFTRRLEYRTDLIQEFSKNRTAREYIALSTKLGRLPVADEFPKLDRLVEAFGSMDRVSRLALRAIDRDAFDGSRMQRREDILTFIAMLRLQGLRPPVISALPSSVRGDISANWKSYGEALKEGESFLFSMGQVEKVRAAFHAAPVGKLLPTDLYLHQSAEDDLPPLLRLIVFAAKRIVGDVSYNVLKISIDGRAVSFLSYPMFEDDAHPALSRSVRVYLPRADFEVRNFDSSDNPPILHRKESLIGSSHHLHQRFRQLTEDEERHGLLSAPDIGHRKSWESLLTQSGLAIDGHRVVQRTETAVETSSTIDTCQGADV